jgi:hypothetical protein
LLTEEVGAAAMAEEVDSAGEAEVTGLVGEVMRLSPVELTHLEGLPAVALVGDSAVRGGFLPVELLIAEITAALMTVVSEDAITITTFTMTAFVILMGALSISAMPTLDIRTIPTINHMRTTTTMGILASSVQCRKNWPR